MFSTENGNKDQIIDNSNIKPGNVIVGLSSTGISSYDKEYNSGIGSNGLTSARHDVLSKYLKSLYPESFDNEVPDELTYCGSKKLTDTLKNFDLNIGKMLLSPTRSYAPLLKNILNSTNKYCLLSRDGTILLIFVLNPQKIQSSRIEPMNWKVKF